MKVFIAGFPNRVGGAGGEALHAAILWKRYGLDVGWIPMWNTTDKAMVQDLQQRGMEVHTTSPKKLRDVPGLAGSWVVMFCCEPAAKAAKHFQELKCKLVGVPCMTFWQQGYRHVEWDAVVCQSEFQRTILRRPDAHLVRGAIAFWEMDYLPRPHAPGEPFVLGRIARGTPTKWSSELYSIYSRVPNPRAELLGVSNAIAKRLGPAPEWAHTRPPGAIDPIHIYRELHCYLTANGEDRENWPRVGLEAMAYGVPIIAENKAGWAEMIRHGATGWLYDTPAEASRLATEMANNEGARLAVAKQARHYLETELANPDKIWDGWRRVFGIADQSVSGPPPLAAYETLQLGTVDDVMIPHPDTLPPVSGPWFRGKEPSPDDGRDHVWPDEQTDGPPVQATLGEPVQQTTETPPAETNPLPATFLQGAP